MEVSPPLSLKHLLCMFYRIPVFARFQWLNYPQVVSILSKFLKPSKRGRKGYDKVLMFRWLIYKHLMKCSYRDLESMSHIDYSTFIKFRKRLICTSWFPRIFTTLTSVIAQQRKAIFLLLDSSFVQTYSTHGEQGSAYSGYKEKNGFKLHQIIDYATRLPLLQYATSGARADVVWGTHMIRAAPCSWNVQGLAADKGYDSEYFVHDVFLKWKNAEIAIPLRNIPYGNEKNRRLRGAKRTNNPDLYNKRSEIERYFSRKKRVFHLGEERTRHLKNFRANCYMTSIMEILEWLSKPELWMALFTKLNCTA